MLCVGQFGACLEVVSVCFVWDSLERVWGIDFVLCGRVWGGFGGMSLCCVWDSLVWVWENEGVLCMGQFGAGLGE